MAGTKEGSIKAAKTARERHGADFHRRNAIKGGNALWRKIRRGELGK